MIHTKNCKIFSRKQVRKLSSDSEVVDGMDITDSFITLKILGHTLVRNQVLSKTIFPRKMQDTWNQK